MKVLIVEDEIVAANRLKKLVQACDPEVEIMATIDSVLDTVNFLNDHTPDLIFLDIQLADGICFEIFQQLQLDAPVIFTTAYDEYMQKAFKVNSIDYLLKPVREEDLKAGIEKYKRLNKSLEMNNLRPLFEDYIKNKQAYKCRFMVKSGRSYVSIETSVIAYFIAQNKLNYLVTKEGKRFVVDFSLDQLEEMLDPRTFKKINRNYIVSFNSVEKVEPYFNNRMILSLQPAAGEDVLVSRSYLQSFKSWMDM